MVFDRYRNQDDLVPFDKLPHFIREFYEANQLPLSDAEGQEILTMLQSAGVNVGGCLRFAEFVRFIRKEQTGTAPIMTLQGIAVLSGKIQGLQQA